MFSPGSSTEEEDAMPVKSISARQLEGFTSEYKTAPDKYLLGIEARSIWEGQGLGNLCKVGPWSLGGKQMKKPTRDFSVQLGSWQEVGEAIGVERSSDRIEPVEAALTGLCSCVSEAITVNCARTNVKLEGLEVSARLEVDPGPIVGAKDPKDWDKTLKRVHVEITAHGGFSAADKKVIEEGATRSPVHHIFSRALQMDEKFRYVP
jgi:uncharacterized OsmC-like protein